MNCKICGQIMGREKDQLHRRTFYCRNINCGDKKTKEHKTLYEKLITIKKKVMQQ